MRTKLLTAIFSLIVTSVIARGANTDTLFFDGSWNPCIKNEARYYRLVNNDGNKFIVKDMFINHMPQMIAVCSSKDPIIKDGKCTFFDEKGLKSSEGYYFDNKPAGTWVWWEDEGRDSTVAEYRPDGTRNFLKFSKSYLNKNDNGIYEMVDEMPYFPGGSSELVKFISKEFQIPKEDKKKGLTGIFYITFVVDENGNAINPVIQNSISQSCDQAAIAMINNMPKWTPGKLDNKKVKVKMIIPIKVNK